MTLLDNPRSMTTEEMEALPDDGRERWLINGELREGDATMTKRNRGHSRIEANFCGKLFAWLETQPVPRGEVLVGEAGVRLRRDPDTTVGIDVAYISAKTALANPDEDRVVEGVPLLVIEVLSPSDTQKSIDEKVQSYLDSGVPHVWMASVRFKTVTVYQPDALPQLFNVTHTISAEPHLPGFRVALAEVFNK